jgi:hypothetical protein
MQRISLEELKETYNRYLNAYLDVEEGRALNYPAWFNMGDWNRLQRLWEQLEKHYA